MNSKLLKMILIVAFAAATVLSATYTVSKPGGRGAYHTIKEAIEAAEAANADEIEIVILDYGTYEEQVTIYEKKNFILRSENPTSSRKPVIEYQDKENVGPKNVEEAQDSAKITYERNGAIRVWNSYNVKIEGIAISGGGNYPFGYDAVWKDKNNQAWPLQHGNTGISILVSGKVIIRHCDISKAFFGFYLKDRNEGGIFANSNPADIQTWKVVPLSGFGRTGDHLIEYCRIHDNSFGFFTESAWDLGSVIRYNLFYENHHPKGQSAKIKNITSEGNNLTGGAMVFKDHIISPLTIHNNTFWHNTYTFVGLWRTGEHYLIFNNIVAEPYQDSEFKDAWQCLDPYFQYRMYHCVYAAHVLPIEKQQQYAQVTDPITNEQVREPVTLYNARILNNFGEIQAIDWTYPVEVSDGSTVPFVFRNAKLQGNLVVSNNLRNGGFEAGNNIRWLETKFQSTDPADPNFLVPDWDDSLVNRYIVDQGYPAVAVIDPDGSPADLGAIPKEGGIFKNQVVIKPASPVVINGTSASVSFTLSGSEIDGKVGSMVDPKIVYARWINSLPATVENGNSMGQAKVMIPQRDIIEIKNLPAIKMGLNLLTFTVPARSDSNLYAFLELFIEGKDPETGEKVISVAGSLPYRKIEYAFEVKILSAADKKTELKSVQAGEVVVLQIKPKRLDNKAWNDSTPIDKADVNLISMYNLLDKNDEILKIPTFRGTYQTEVKFTRVPDGGNDIVQVNGLFSIATSGGHRDTLPISGHSDQITIKPGPPDYLEFKSPPSKGVDKIDPGREYDVKIAVYDKYGNRIDQKTDVTLTSQKTNKGDVVGGGPKTSSTDTTGIVHFLVEVTEGAQKNDSIPLVASLKVTGKTDNATLIVGEPRDKLLIFYPGDSAGTEIDEKLSIEGCSDQFIPIVVKRIGKKDNKFVVVNADSDTVSFDIETSSGIGVYLTNEPGAQKITKVSKMKGQVTLWIKSTGLAAPNGSIRVYPIDNPAVLSGERGKINFIQCNPGILKAAYFADKGDGRVNRLEIYYDDTLAATEIPDTFQLFWPNRQTEPKIVLGSDIGSVKLDANNRKHLTITLKEPFNPVPLVTVNSVPTLGISLWRNPLLEEAPLIKANFNIDDSVGPLINSAVLVEKLDKSKDDTIYITFSEGVNNVKGGTLKLIKKNEGKEINLEVKEVFNYSGDTLKIVVKSLGENSPVEGDSLCILSSGSIIDINKNHAHKDNRPVMIRLKGVQPSVVHAYYKDYNGDGKVDFITVRFNKKVKADSTRIKFVWADGDSTPTLDKSKGKITYNGTDTMTLIVEVTGFFKDRIKTSGAMSVEAIYQNFGNAKSVWSVDDSAAPVIIEGRLHPGSIADDGNANKDTLKVTFSEHVKRIETDQKEIFSFYHKGLAYGMNLTKHREEGSDVISFIVDKIIITNEDLIKSEFNYPKNNDSLRMRTGTNGIFADDNNNYQKDPANRMAPLRVLAVPTKVEVKAGPMPFVPGSKELKIIVKPKAKMVESCSTYARVTIYDRAGNVVHSKVGDYKPEKGSVEIKWNGYNLKGKKVDRGTYMAVVNYSLFLEKGNGKELDEKKAVNLKIAVGAE
jgi:hypothetical protein